MEEIGGLVFGVDTLESCIGPLPPAMYWAFPACMITGIQLTGLTSLVCHIQVAGCAKHIECVRHTWVPAEEAAHRLLYQPSQ